MKKISAFLILAGAVFIGWTAVSAIAQNEEAMLRSEQANVDRSMALGARSEEDRIRSVADEFEISANAIRDLRSRGRGWGEIMTELSAAEQLNRTNAAAYPATQDALTRIESLRRQGREWGTIARDLDFRLAPVVSGMQQRQAALSVSGSETGTTGAAPAVGNPNIPRTFRSNETIQDTGSSSGEGQSQR